MKFARLLAWLTNARRHSLIEHRDALEILAKELLSKEILYQNDLVRLIGKRPFERETVYQAYKNKGVAEEIKEEIGKEAKPEATEPQTLPI